MALASRDKAAAIEDLDEINQQFDTQLEHVNDLKELIQKLIDLPDLNLNNDRDSEKALS